MSEEEPDTSEMNKLIEREWTLRALTGWARRHTSAKTPALEEASINIKLLRLTMWVVGWYLLYQALTPPDPHILVQQCPPPPVCPVVTCSP